MTKAIVLAAGVGSRLHPYTSSLPKGMVPFLGKALLIRQIESLRRAGVGEVILVGGAHADKLPKSVDSILINRSYQTTNMVESLLCARQKFDGSEDIVISYSDIVCEPAVIEKLMAADGDLVISSDVEWERLWRMRMDDPLSDAESFKVSEDGYVVELGRKAESYDDIQAQYIGLVKVPKSKQVDFIAAYDQIASSSGLGNAASMYMTDLIQGLIDQGWLVSPSFINGGWIEVDTVDDLNKYTAAFEKDQLEDLIKLSEVGGDARNEGFPVSEIKNYINNKMEKFIEIGRLDNNEMLAILSDISRSHALGKRDLDLLSKISRKVEIAQKIYSRYDMSTWSPSENAILFDHEEFAFAVSVLLFVFTITNDYTFLNAVFKGIDLLPDGNEKFLLSELSEYILRLTVEP